MEETEIKANSENVEVEPPVLTDDMVVDNKASYAIDDPAEGKGWEKERLNSDDERVWKQNEKDAT